MNSQRQNNFYGQYNVTYSYDDQIAIQRMGITETFHNCLQFDVDINMENTPFILLYQVEQHRNEAEPTFYYHTDHLGSAAYLTNQVENMVQTLNYLPYGEDWVDIQHLNETMYPVLGIYSFNGKEKDYESGFHYYGARYYNSELSIWLSVDPMSDKYPSLSPYAYCADNPVKFIDPKGREIDLSNLSEREKNIYLKNIEILKQNKMFQVYYEHLEKSDIKYIIKFGQGRGGSGSFNPKTNEVYSIDDMYSLSQELFHAYQSDIGVYSSKDLSVREAEADIVSQNIMYSLNIAFGGGSNLWDENMSTKQEYIDDNYNFKEGILSSKQFDIDFNTAVDKRIAFYKSREKRDGVKAPMSYIQQNSGVGALAIKKLVRSIDKK
jgi:RHS repeat-associated protein